MLHRSERIEIYGGYARQSVGGANTHVLANVATSHHAERDGNRKRLVSGTDSFRQDLTANDQLLAVVR
jgi:hypothetical protein